MAVLGGFSTMFASYLAKVRGSGEPEFSSVRGRELSSFLREVHAFVIDDGSFLFFFVSGGFGLLLLLLLSSEPFHACAGDKPGIEYDQRIMMYRERFEIIIRTDGEDSRGSGHGGQHSRQQSTSYPAQYGGPPTHVANGHLGVLPVQSGPGGHVMDEKQQMWKNEKALGGMV